MSVWKVGMRYVDPDLMLENNLAYAFGDSMYTYLNSKSLGEVDEGDIVILAKSREDGIRKVGIVRSSTNYCLPDNIEGTEFVEHGIPESQDLDLISKFKDKAHTDVVYFLVDWLPIDGRKIYANFDNVAGFTIVHDSKNIINAVNNYKKMENIIEILRANKNIVLTGAPGTGKTFLAKEIAKQIIFTPFVLQNPDGSFKSDLEVFKDNYLKEYCTFVQFHPSYDYTDFVEGLRPKNTDNTSDIGFELKNGIFKEFCLNAKKTWEIDKEKKENERRNYVFIIDEINRAEISKVFGELFFSIDPGYRGEDGKVQTQYSNIQTEYTCFSNIKKDYFFVPENVYIIGTMNDIDRSVESFDFAMRRRFAWIEILSKERLQMWDGEIDKDKEEAGKKMEALNNAIEKTEGLSSSYHIGPAYFLKLKHYNGDFEKLWKYHIGLLIVEYLRGMSDSKKKYDILKNAYDNQ